MADTRPPTTYGELAHVLHSLPVLCREKRRLRGLSLRDASQEIGISFNTLTRFEKGQDAMLSNVVAVLNWIGMP